MLLGVWRRLAALIARWPQSEWRRSRGPIWVIRQLRTIIWTARWPTVGCLIIGILTVVEKRESRYQATEAHGATPISVSDTSFKMWDHGCGTVAPHRLPVPSYTAWCQRQLGVQLLRGCYSTVQWPGCVKFATIKSLVRCLSH